MWTVFEIRESVHADKVLKIGKIPKKNCKIKGSLKNWFYGLLDLLSSKKEKVRGSWVTLYCLQPQENTSGSKELFNLLEKDIVGPLM